MSKNRLLVIAGLTMAATITGYAGTPLPVAAGPAPEPSCRDKYEICVTGAALSNICYPFPWPRDPACEARLEAALEECSRSYQVCLAASRLP
jgi:hypothetical protein